MGAIKIIIINLNEFHLELFICGGIWRERGQQKKEPLEMK